MMQAFKTHFIPALRAAGFTGSFPHFRRRLPDRLDLLMVQYYSAGGEFTVELTRTPPDGFTAGDWAEVPVDKLKVSHAGPGHPRFRLPVRNPARSGVTARQFWKFGPRDYEPAEEPRPQAHYDAIADAVRETFETDGEAWFASPGPLGTGATPEGPPPKAPWPIRLLDRLLGEKAR